MVALFTEESKQKIKRHGSPTTGTYNMAHPGKKIHNVLMDTNNQKTPELQESNTCYSVQGYYRRLLIVCARLLQALLVVLVFFISPRV